MYGKKNRFGILPSTCACEIDECVKNYGYTKSLINDSVIACDEITNI